MDTAQDVIIVGAWRAERATGALSSAAADERLEPKVMDLLFLLASRPGAAFTKDQIMDRLWPGVVVGDDTLARAVSRLRKALGDDAKTPRYVETLPKRGYRLIAEVRADEGVAARPQAAGASQRGARALALPGIGIGLAVVVATALAVTFLPWAAPPDRANAGTRVMVERANDFYFQYKRADNEAAIDLYERILSGDPDHAPALAGIANALVQRAVRWSDEPGAPEYTKLRDALRSGRTATAAAKRTLARAQAYAERAVRLAPHDPVALKALGFVRSARGDFAEAISSYRRAVAIDRDAWGPLINIGDVLEISGRASEALPYFEAAYAAMTRVYDLEPVRIRPWYGELGVLIGDRYGAIGNFAQAERWYRRVLSYAPLHVRATDHLAAVLGALGDAKAGSMLCENLRRRMGADVACGRVAH